MTMKEPRRHHYCPAGYLANFATPRDRNGKIIVTNAKTADERPSTPDNEGHQRDFYRIEPNSADGDPLVIEKTFGEIETPALAAIRRLIESDKLPNDEDLCWIINFIGLLSARVPRRRKFWEEFESEIYKRISQLTVSSKPIFNSVIAQMKGQIHKDDPTYEEMREFINSDRYKIEIHQNSLIETMLHSASVTTDLLLKRNWSLVIADCDKEFITSDNPVVLRWINPVRGPFPPGFGLSNTEVSVTLSPKHMLIGLFENVFGNFKVNELGVAAVNEGIHVRADRWLYSKSGNPCTVSENEKVISFQERINGK